VNWLDIVLILIIASSIFSGFASGMARVIVGMGTTILAIILSVWFYGSMAGVFQEYVSSRAIANIIGFFVVFVCIMVAGGLLGALLAKLFKWVGLGWLDRLLGGALGLVRGILISVVLIMIVMAFTATPPPRSVVNSRIAPYVVGAASVLTAITPHELKDGFRESYERVKKAWNDTFETGAKKPPTSQF
jgi:membrane protein required for colicin V production